MPTSLDPYIIIDKLFFENQLNAHYFSPFDTFIKQQMAGKTIDDYVILQLKNSVELVDDRYSLLSCGILLEDYNLTDLLPMKFSENLTWQNKRKLPG